MISFIILVKVGSLDHQKPVIIMTMIGFIMFIKSKVVGPSEARVYHGDDWIYCY